MDLSWVPVKRLSMFGLLEQANKPGSKQILVGIHANMSLKKGVLTNKKTNTNRMSLRTHP